MIWWNEAQKQSVCWLTETDRSRCQRSWWRLASAAASSCPPSRAPAARCRRLPRGRGPVRRGRRRAGRTRRRGRRARTTQGRAAGRRRRWPHAGGPGHRRCWRIWTTRISSWSSLQLLQEDAAPATPAPVPPQPWTPGRIRRAPMPPWQWTPSCDRHRKQQQQPQQEAEGRTKKQALGAVDKRHQGKGSMQRWPNERAPYPHYLVSAVTAT